jgi:ABC-type polar amino acid transport system ATPase subunit
MPVRANGQPLLVVEHLSLERRDPSGMPVKILDDVSLTVEPGEIVAIFGPSGSGKTSLLRSIVLLIRPDCGVIQYGGRDWMRRPHGIRNIRERIEYTRALRLYRAECGLVFQHFNLFPHMNAWQNVALAVVRVRGRSWREAEEAARAQLSRVGLGNRANSYPHQLSGGERQRVAICRALVMQPRMMLFDEPTSSLDPSLRESVLVQLRDLAAEGMTMILVTHEQQFATTIANRIVHMRCGRLYESLDNASVAGASIIDPVTATSLGA